MPDDKLSVEQFAQRIKQRDSRLSTVPDDVLVKKVLERRPQLATFMTSSPSAPPVPEDLTKQNSFPSRVMDRVGESAEGSGKMVDNLLSRSRENFKQAKDKKDYKGMALAPYNAEASGLGDVARGIGGVTTPGIISRIANKEDPASIFADAALNMIPSGEPSGVVAKATEQLKSDMTPSIVGAHTRALQGFRTIEKEAGHVPVNPSPVMEWIGKAEELAQKGYKMPKVMSDFQNWIESKSKGSAQKVPQGFMDTPASEMPLTVKDAREFYTAMNEAIPWDEEGYGGKGGRMHYVVDQARKALQNSTSESLSPYGLDKTLNQAMSDYSRVARWREKSYGVGWLGGKIAGYGAGGVMGHPLMMGHLGGKAGEGIAGSMVRSITEAKQ